MSQKVTNKEIIKALLLLGDIDVFMKALPAKEQIGCKEFIKELLIAINTELSINMALLEEVRDPEDMEFLQHQMVKLNQKRTLTVQLLTDITKEEERKKEAGEIEEPAIPDKKIIFLQSEAGNYFVERDAKDIPRERLEELKELIENLETYDYNSFSNNAKSRSFVNNDKLAGLAEIKAWNIRVVYETIPPDVVLVVAMYYKNQDNPKLFLEFMSRRMINSKPAIDYLKKEILTSPERKQNLVEQNAAFKERFISSLTSKSKG